MSPNRPSPPASPKAMPLQPSLSKSLREWRVTLPPSRLDLELRGDAHEIDARAHAARKIARGQGGQGGDQRLAQLGRHRAAQGPRAELFRERGSVGSELEQKAEVRGSALREHAIGHVVDEVLFRK